MCVYTLTSQRDEDRFEGVQLPVYAEVKAMSF